MTKFELARTAGRWRPRSRTYVALAILFVTAWPTNADVFHDAFAVRGPRIGAEGEVSSRRGHLRPLLLHSFLGGPCVGQALATEAIAECIRSGSVGEAESNIGLLCLVPTPATADWDAPFTVEGVKLEEDAAEASWRKCEFDQMRKVPLVH